MYNNSKKYLTISQFANIYNINKKTLIYYDEIDLFKPAFVKKNGYRYYDLHQAELFDVILMLKKLGMPLKKIKEYLQNRSIAEFQNILLEQKLNIQNQIKELNKMKNIIKNRLNILDSIKNIEIGKMSIQDMEEEYIILSPYLKNKDDVSLAKAWFNHINSLDNGFSLGAMIEDSDIINGNYSNCSYFYTKANNKPKNYEYFIKPAGKYLVFYFSQHWINFDKIYEVAKKYLKDKSLCIKGYSYEEYILGDITSKSYDEYITKFMIQVS